MLSHQERELYDTYKNNYSEMADALVAGVVDARLQPLVVKQLESYPLLVELAKFRFLQKKPDDGAQVPQEVLYSGRFLQEHYKSSLLWAAEQLFLGLVGYSGHEQIIGMLLERHPAVAEAAKFRVLHGLCEGGQKAA